MRTTVLWESTQTTPVDRDRDRGSGRVIGTEIGIEIETRREETLYCLFFLSSKLSGR